MMLCDCFTLLPLEHSAMQLKILRIHSNWHVWGCRSEHPATLLVPKIQSAPQCRWV